MVPTVCNGCGNIRLAISQPCPYCSGNHPLSIPSDDERHLVFLALIERLKLHLNAKEICSFEPTDREFNLLSDGDQLIDSPVIWRILCKKSAPFDSTKRIWMTLHSMAKVSQVDGEYFIDKFPPQIDTEVLELLPMDYVRDHHYLPIFREENKLMVAGIGESSQREALVSHFNDYDITFCRTSRSAFQKAYRAYYANYPARGCGATYQPHCNYQWQQLATTDAVEVRHCATCASRVYLLTEEDDPSLFVDHKLRVAKFTDQGVTRPKFSFEPGEVVPEGIDDPFSLG